MTYAHPNEAVLRKGDPESGDIGICGECFVVFICTDDPHITRRPTMNDMNAMPPEQLIDIELHRQQVIAMVTHEYAHKDAMN